MSEINFLPGIGIAASGLAAQRARLDVVAQNIANASTTRTADGQPYRRRRLELEAGSEARVRVGGSHERPSRTSLARTSSSHLGGAAPLATGRRAAVGVKVAGVSLDSSPFPRVYEPGHPDADEQGYVDMPNVNLLSEMVDLMLASRAYEANLAVLEASREAATKTLDLLR